MSAPAFALILGLLYTGLGAFAMLPSLVVAREGLPYLFGLFAVSGVLNALHIGIGLWGLVAWSGAYGAVAYARMVGIVLAILALGGVVAILVPGALPLRGGYNIALHALTALAAAYVGFRSVARRPLVRATVQERRHHSDRRVAERPVALERRGSADRRLGPAAP